MSKNRQIKIDYFKSLSDEEKYKALVKLNATSCSIKETQEEMKLNDEASAELEAIMKLAFYKGIPYKECLEKVRSGEITI